MVSGDPTQSEEKGRKAPRPSRSTLVRIVRALKRRSYSRERDRDKEHAENERTMAQWTRRLGVLTVVLAGCSVLNVVIIALQLGEMRSGGIDTHDLVAATRNLVSAGKDQARALNRLEIATEKGAGATQGLVGIGGNELSDISASAKAAGLQAKASITQADVARNTLIASSRAWLAPGVINVVKRGDGKYAVQVAYTDQGREPAFGFEGKIAVARADAASLDNTPTGDVRPGPNTTCNGLRSESGSFTVFPSAMYTGLISQPFAGITPDALLVVQGCFVYRTVGGIHRTEFCAFSDPDAGPSATVETRVFKWCAEGNHAD